MEECFLILNNEDLLRCSMFLDNLKLNSKLIQIRLVVKKELFETTLKEIFSKISFDHSALIKGIEIIRDDYKIYEEDNFSFVEEIRTNSIIKFKIPRGMKLKVYKTLIVLNEVEGEIILMNEDSTLICNKANRAKITNIKSTLPSFSKEKVFLTGDMVL